ncbi:MAG: response regulator [Planctomycetota bacterium]|jgi:CheY-like chemotaxis protein/HPt (histidine-containing phosphotransfer) domain-containing protein
MIPRSQPEAAEQGKKPARVLFAEDDSLTSRMLASLLSDTAGIEVTRASDGQEAVRRALAEPFELILMDMEMPNVDGYEATQRLREAGVNVPIVALTAHALDGDRRRCIAAGCTDYLSKPFSRRVLLETLRTYLPSMEHYLGQGTESPGVQTDHEDPTCRREPTEPDGAAGPEDAGQVVDVARLIDRFGDAESVVEFMPAYLDTAQEHMAMLTAAVEAGQAKEIARLAHALRGAALNLGANRLAQAAHELERAGRRADMATATGVLPDVRDKYEKMRAFLSQGEGPADLFRQKDPH